MDPRRCQLTSTERNIAFIHIHAHGGRAASWTERRKEGKSTQTVIKETQWASGGVLTWMFCLERDVWPLSHPRQRKPDPGHAGPL